MSETEDKARAETLRAELKRLDPFPILRKSKDAGK
jgi:hypothetical protein